jgi:hypothetical protein
LRAIGSEKGQEATPQGGLSGTRLSTETISRLNRNSIRRKPVGDKAEPTPPPPPPHQDSVDKSGLPIHEFVPKHPVSQSQPNKTFNYRPQEEDAHNHHGIREQIPGHRQAHSVTELDNPTNKIGISRRPVTSSSKQNDSPLGSAGANVQYQNRWSADLGYLRTWSPADRSETDPGFRSSLDAPHPQGLPNRMSTDHGVSAANFNRRKMPSPTRNQQDSKFHITLIRRDPAFGNQWNVGTISGSEANRSAIDIDISTPGYGRFINNDEALSLSSLGLNLPKVNRDGLSSSIPAAPASIPATTSKTAPSETDVGPRKFRRKVLTVSHGRSRGHSLSDSYDDSRQMNSRVVESHSPSKLTPSRMKSGYYTFTSPWNGTCTFVASVNGRSLKCKHTIPGPSTTGLGAADASHQNLAVTVAEIRFNVPFPLGAHHHRPGGHHHHHHHHPSSSSQDKTKRGSLAHIITSNVQRVKHARPGSRSVGSESSPSVLSSPFPFHARGRLSESGSSDQDENTPPPVVADGDGDRLDLSLAREHAGGGFQGKSAKLGKLIVEDEGIKMLDLVVAACMGVWWRSYYQL